MTRRIALAFFLSSLALAALLGGCASSPEAVAWEPVKPTRRFVVASIKSNVLATVELRLLRVEHGLADRWAGEDRDALRLAILPEVRLQEILASNSQSTGRKHYAPRVSVFLGQEARVGVQQQHAYVRDFELTSHPPSMDPVIGGFQTGLKCRLLVDLKEDEGWAESLQTWIEVSGEVEISELVELESRLVEFQGASGELEIPKLKVRRHALDLEVQEDVVTLLAPPMGEGSEVQIVILLKVSLTEIQEEPQSPR